MIETTQVKFAASNGCSIAGIQTTTTGASSNPKKEIRILAVHGWILPGHGLSDPLPPTQTYYLWDHALAILDVSMSLSWDTFILLGHSMGGHVAYLFAGCYPEKLDALVVIESVGHINKLKIPGNDSASMRDFLDRRRILNIEEQGSDASMTMMKPKTLYESVEAAAKARMNGVTKVSLQAAMALCERGLERVWTTDKRLWMRHFFQWDHAGIKAIMESIKCRVLVILGSASPLLSESDPLMGTHHLHLESETREMVASLLREFLWSSPRSSLQLS
ncbi:Alpha/Beta hydrolase protein [Obelidium mucronatum]|nr:Alpha/Beta hydrolase protein [Obelidium mucronatum]